MKRCSRNVFSLFSLVLFTGDLDEDVEGTLIRFGMM